jgi:hypothetical protein
MSGSRGSPRSGKVKIGIYVNAPSLKIRSFYKHLFMTFEEFLECNSNLSTTLNEKNWSANIPIINQKLKKLAPDATLDLSKTHFYYCGTKGLEFKVISK